MPEQVDNIAKILKKEFREDGANSIDKRIKEEDRFGYMSLHLIFQLNSHRSNLKEYSIFKDIKFEVQIRTILQHAWAEIEHDIGYKTSIEIPSDFKRRFFRLASILELADEEFQQIVNNIEDYKTETRLKLENKEKLIEINKESLTEYMLKSKELTEIQNNIATSLGDEMHDLVVDVHDILSKLNYLEYNCISEIDDDIKRYKNEIIKLAIEFNKSFYNEEELTGGSWGPDVGLFYLLYLKIMRSENDDYIKKYLDEYIYNHSKENDKLYENLKTAYKVIKE